MTFYSVIKCPKCGIIQMSTIKEISNTVFRCVSCRASRKIRKQDGTQLQLFGEFATPREASLACQRIKKELAEKVEDFENIR